MYQRRRSQTVSGLRETSAHLAVERDTLAATTTKLTIEVSEQLLYRNVQRFRGGLVFKVHRLLVAANKMNLTNETREKNCQVLLSSVQGHFAHKKQRLPETLQ